MVSYDEVELILKFKRSNAWQQTVERKTFIDQSCENLVIRCQPSPEGVNVIVVRSFTSPKICLNAMTMCIMIGEEH